MVSQTGFYAPQPIFQAIVKWNSWFLLPGIYYRALASWIWQGITITVPDDSISREICQCKYWCIGKTAAVSWDYFRYRLPGGIPPLPNNSTASAPAFNKEYPLILCTGQPFRLWLLCNRPWWRFAHYKFVPALQGVIYVNPGHPMVQLAAPPFYRWYLFQLIQAALILGHQYRLIQLPGWSVGQGPVLPGRYIVEGEAANTEMEPSSQNTEKKQPSTSVNVTGRQRNWIL